MAIYYVDIASGNDTTGDGSFSNPYLTCYTATRKTGGPHTIRVAKTTAPTTISSSSVTFTNNNANLATSVSLVGTIAAGDYIGKPTAAGNGAVESYYKVSSISASTIVLTSPYFGTTETLTSIKKLNPVTITSNLFMYVDVAGSIVSGGWTLSTQTQDGETWYKAASYWITLNASSQTVSYLNGVEGSNGVACNTGATISNCSFAGCAWALNPYDGVNASNVTAQITSNRGAYLYGTTLSNPTVISNSIFYAALGVANVCSGAAVNNGKYVNCKVYGGTTAFGGETSFIYCENCEARYATTGYKSVNGSIFKNCLAESCTNGFGNSTTSNMYIEGCTASNCTYGMYATQAFGYRAENCTFSDCTYGVYVSDGYCHQVDLINCSFLRPVTLAVYRIGTAGPVNLMECSIDPASSSKAYALTAADRYNYPTHLFQNSFGGKYGIGYSNGEVVSDTSVRRSSSGVSLKVQLTSDFYKKFTDVKLGVMYATSGVGQTLSVYIQANSGWVGSITPTLRLNGKTIKTFSAITSLPTAWAQYSYTCDNADVTSDGELSLVYRVATSNNTPFWVDDFTVV